MNCSVALYRAITASSLLASALLLTSLIGCGASDPQSPPQPQGGGHSGGEAGSLDTAGASDDGGASTATGGSSTAGSSTAGSSTAGSSTAGDTGAPIPLDSCVSDSDCDDGLYCNGKELCKSVSLPPSDVKVCMRRRQGPCGPSACDEATDSCDCSDSDHDHDNFETQGCTTSTEFDCDDDDGNRHPLNGEVCDDHDEDCRDDTIGGKDDDHDLYIDQLCSNEREYQPIYAHSQPPLSNSGTDCDDGRANVHPGAAEICDNRDNNCNGETDEVSGGEGKPKTFYKDDDRDYWGDEAQPIDTLCPSPPSGYSELKGDCNDHDPRISPAREEICNGVDDDCNSTVDKPDKPADLMFGQPYDSVTEFECQGAPGWKVKTCPPDRLDCDGGYKNACETVATTLCNCHACGRTCAFSCGEADCEEISAISTGNLHTCALVQAAGSASGGTLACWGRNVYGQLGNGNTKDTLQAVKVLDLSNVTAFASGRLHTCAVALGGRLFCWGNNDDGQLGSGPTTGPVPFPVEVRGSSFLSEARSVGSGSFHTCAIFDEGRLACWGRGDHGELGNDDSESANRPTRVVRLVNDETEFVNDASQVVAGFQHSCSLSAGHVECWGDNSSGQLGVDPTVLPSASTATPVPLPVGLHVDELSASGFHTCARAGADVYCWGRNISHELALQTGGFGPPTKIPLPFAAISIATGSYFGCALGNTKTASCWGSNDAGELGNLADPNSVLPNPIALLDVTDIFGGVGEHVCATTEDKATWCWGNNNLGQLGNGQKSLDPQPVPSRVLRLSGSLPCTP